jgi:hypothetical protein
MSIAPPALKEFARSIARDHFGSPLRYCGNDLKVSKPGANVPEVCRIGDDYISDVDRMSEMENPARRKRIVVTENLFIAS